MRLLEFWHQDKGGKAPPGAEILQVALKFGVLPDAVEQMDNYWFRRCLLWLESEANASRET